MIKEHGSVVERKRAMEAHQRALDKHSTAWEDMHAQRLLHGADSPEYRQARADVLDALEAAKQARRESDAAQRSGERCPTCGRAFR